MMYSSILFALIFVFIVSAVGTAVIDIIFRFLGKRGYMGNLFPNVRGGIPRAVGIVPFIILSFYMLPKFNNLILIIGIFALIDDILGRRKSYRFNIEYGQLSRGIGIILVMIVGLAEGLGLSAIFIALMVQPMNISDMQPGSTCIVTIIMSVLTILVMLLIGSPDYAELPAMYTPLLILVVCLAYSPLDFSGKIMLGEVGNHTFGVALGTAFYVMGGLVGVIVFGIITTALIAFVRRNNLTVFFRQKLRLLDPTFGDFFMDVLTGGGLGDLVRKWVLKDKQYDVRSPLLILLGFRRLLYNPHASHAKSYIPDNYVPRLERRE
ncbi:cell wall biosynthesis protein [uncultured Methanobrevibacter sp.]|uniref:cell wall biosynthesis protein n=1 Tax=uncultured Methanobrevibacter sp. TaxID=253161 RepID=UPI0025D59798|nr:cell wall biosynthesis protein [uncultured Methanobrevibacter sp.]MEE1133883.1 cell wall biosynthesis protein [Methanobrevibacter sp.]MEE3490472.1 cell wall biosynthesis protein [Methanobrevibacter sp.]